MRWTRGQRSGSVEDRRAQGGGGMGGFGGMSGLPIPTSRMGKGGGCLSVLIVLGLVIFGGTQFLGGGEGTSFGIPDSLDRFPQAPAGSGLPTGSSPVPGSPDPDEELAGFVGFVVDDLQAMWAQEFERSGRRYRPTRLVLFRESTNSGCGAASAATGPFYCPADGKVYLDLAFFRELRDRFGAPGDFAQAYVIAHEVGHHVQNLTGISREVQERSREDPSQANELSVRLELQADCLAGVWAHSTYQRGILEPGDLEEGLAAAAAVGDDRIQSAATGRIDPESFTHGTADQRRQWFDRGYRSGRASDCDTFAVESV